MPTAVEKSFAVYCSKVSPNIFLNSQLKIIDV
jgi:hypothetical protein